MEKGEERREERKRKRLMRRALLPKQVTSIYRKVIALFKK